MIRTFEELKECQEHCAEQFKTKITGASGKRAVVLCGGTGCLSSNSDVIRKKFEVLVSENHLEDRIQIFPCDILDIPDHFPAASFDAVTANPPYFPSGRGWGNERPRLHAARHESTASLDDFVKCAAYLLRPRGAFYMIHRPERLVDILVSCRSHELEPKVLRFVCPREGKAPNMLLIECRRKGGRELKILPDLIVRSADGSRSPELRQIYGQTKEH